MYSQGRTVTEQDLLKESLLEEIPFRIALSRQRCLLGLPALSLVQE